MRMAFRNDDGSKRRGGEQRWLGRVGRVGRASQCVGVVHARLLKVVPVTSINVIRYCYISAYPCMGRPRVPWASDPSSVIQGHDHRDRPYSSRSLLTAVCVDGFQFLKGLTLAPD